MDVIMSDVIWGFLDLPAWFFQTILSPFAASYLTAIPASGVVALAIGAILAAVHRETAVLWGFLSVGLAHLLPPIIRQMRDVPDQAGGVLLAFLVIQLVLVAAMIFKSRKSYLSAISIGWFCLSYALFAAFMAGTSLPGGAI